jgi:hypothetical protein
MRDVPTLSMMIGCDADSAVIGVKGVARWWCERGG